MVRPCNQCFCAGYLWGGLILPYATVVLWSKDARNLAVLIHSIQFREVLAGFKVQLAYASQSDEPVSIVSKQGIRYKTFSTSDLPSG